MGVRRAAGARVTGAWAGAWVTAAVGYRLWRARLTWLDGVTVDYAAYWRRRARRPGELLLVALGDSLAQGLTANRPERGFVGLLADGWARSAGCQVGVLNLSVTGATVAEVLAEQVPLLAGVQPDLVTVIVGTNDVTRTSPEEFRDAFAALCTALCSDLSSGSTRPGRWPAARVLVADVPDFRRGPDRARAEQYAAICREVLGGFADLTPVPLHRATRTLRIWELGADLAHPGNAGHRRYAAAFRRALDGGPGRT